MSKYIPLRLVARRCAKRYEGK